MRSEVPPVIATFDGSSGAGTPFHRRHRRRRAGVARLALATAAALTATLVAPVWSVPHARADDRMYEAFYTPPEPLPAGAPGDLIRTEPSRLALEPSGQLGSYVGTGTRIMYRSSDAQGNPVAVTGTYIEPDVPWPGNGPRPLLAYATGPYGVGEQCAPSRLFNQGIHFSQGFDLMFNMEEGFIATLLARGFAIVVTDGVGMGVHGPQSPQWLNRVASGTALLDAARAAQRLPDTSLKPDGPVAFWGYASGGQASLSAAEQAATYAPELRVVGTFADAPVTDVAEAIPGIDGNFFAVLAGYLLRGIIAAYPQTEQAVRDTLTPRGLQMLDWSGRTCLLQGGVDYAFRHLQFWFNTDLTALVSNDPFKSLLAAQRVGNLTPTGPVYITHNRWDPLVPYQPARQTALDWCARGADVQLWTNEQPPLLNKLDINNLLPLYVDGERSIQWLADRFNGVPTTPNCGQL
ncbi:lipase family protein [Mycolicibacterium sarraceniae]|uniref:Secretory lipase family protein n=1 Tax=Mycolicibacterium sarraceniae TaxID=1534348 RepID=A0A7I7SPI6_9MYCO|nr:secretory lipase family protein [Mycolicibacterium sarraceniae]